MRRPTWLKAGTLALAVAMVFVSCVNAWWDLTRIVRSDRSTAVSYGSVGPVFNQYAPPEFPAMKLPLVVMSLLMVAGLYAVLHQLALTLRTLAGYPARPKLERRLAIASTGLFLAAVLLSPLLLGITTGLWFFGDDVEFPGSPGVTIHVGASLGYWVTLFLLVPLPTLALWIPDQRSPTSHPPEPPPTPEYAGLKPTMERRRD